MSNPPRSGWSNLETGAISALDAKDFERLCYELISYEAYERHAGPDLEGPTGDYTADQGRDILLVVSNPPLQTKTGFQQKYRTKPLTEDHNGRTVYSCKSGKNWLDGTLKDARAQTRGQRAAEVLKGGGYFKLMVSQVVPLDRTYKRDGVEATPQEHLERALAARVGTKGASTTGKRVEIFDAQKLRDFLVRVAPEGLLNEWGPKLGLVRMLADVDEWQRAHQIDREEVPFTHDARRTAILGELLAFLEQPQPTTEARAARMLGPPGIGKTRFVLESFLGRRALADRLRVAQNSTEAADAFLKGFWSNHPEAIVVVDDCPDEEVRGLMATFAAKATRPNARLLLITPTKESAQRTRLKSWTIDPLGDSEARRLLEAVAVANMDERTRAKIIQLAEGFPWFVVLLAREAEAAHRGPKDVDEAIDWVLASRSEAAGEALGTLRQERARALLAVSLTRAADWNNLNEAEQEQIARAVGLLGGWPRLRELAEQCRQRGLVRLQLGWHFKYVTPAILEREVVRRLLGPGGTDPGGRRLFFHTNPWAQQLFERLPSLGLSPETMRALAASALEDLRALERIEQVVPSGLAGERLMLIAAWFPEPCARELRRLVASSKDLHGFALGRRDVVGALESVLLQEEGLRDAEAALFLLAAAENESFSNNATAVWASIFLVEMAFVTHPVDRRLGLLRHRLQAATPPERQIALKGLEALLAPPGFRLAPPDARKPVSLPLEDLRRARIEAWALLGERLRDEAETVAGATRALARKAIAAEGHPGILAEALEQLSKSTDTFRDKERAELHETLQRLASVRVGDPTLKEKLHQLTEALAPRSFRERLHDLVGLWGDDETHAEITQRDELLAREALGALASFEPELEWVLSGEAGRGLLFARALGRHDPKQALLPLLLRRARAIAEQRFVAAYIQGLQDILPEDRFRAVLDPLRASPSTFPLFAFAAAWCGLRGKDTQEITHAFEQGSLDEEAMAWVLRLTYGSGLALGEASLLLESVLKHQTPALLGVAMDWASARVRSVPAEAELLGPLLDELLVNYGGTPGTLPGDHGWGRLALARWEYAKAPVFASLRAMLTREGGPPGTVWPVLSRASEQDPSGTWRMLADVLERGDRTAGRLLLSFQFQSLALPLPTNEVMAWVGDDERRGRALVSLLHPAQPRLPEVLRQLTIRFGPDSSIAREIVARMQSTMRMIPSLASHDAERLEVSHAWLKDEAPAVRALARKVTRSLEESRTYHEALEKEERLRYGS
jgi:hypothetical protein